MTKREKLKFENHGKIYSLFLNKVSSGQVNLKLNYQPIHCQLSSYTTIGSVTFPDIESANSLIDIYTWVKNTLPKTDMYIIAHGSFQGSKGSTSHGYRMPISSKERGKGRNRINFQSSNLIVWIHEFHHSIASAMWPNLGEAHRFMKSPPSDKNKQISPCELDDQICLTARPAWIKGTSEADYYIELYENIDRLGGWTKLNDLKKAFEKNLEDTGKISTEE